MDKQMTASKADLDATAKINADSKTAMQTADQMMKTYWQPKRLRSKLSLAAANAELATAEQAVQAAATVVEIASAGAATSAAAEPGQLSSQRLSGEVDQGLSGVTLQRALFYLLSPRGLRRQKPIIRLHSTGQPIIPNMSFCWRPHLPENA
jgi:hypothetical protein